MADGRTLEERIEQVEQEQLSLREEMRAGFVRMATREELRAAVAGLATREELRALGGDLRAEMRAQGDDLRVEMRKFHAESIAANVELRQYIEFVSARHSGQMAENLDATTRRIDRLERRMDAGFTRVTRQFAALRRDVVSLVRPKRAARQKRRKD